MESPDFSPEPMEEDEIESEKPGDASTAKKPRTKAQGRKRTKSGCLSKYRFTNYDPDNQY
jgi:hypothetical protein